LEIICLGTEQKTLILQEQFTWCTY